jgi:esterase/lipase superfamily enzyme
VGRTMHVRWFGHAGARLIAFPTTLGNHNEWPDRRIPDVLHEHLANGWLQLWCVDANHDVSWYNKEAHPGHRAWLHLRYDRYVCDELLPFTGHVNANPFVIAAGASFGAFHAMSLALRNPTRIHRVIGLSGLYDIRGMTGGYSDETVYACNPFEFMANEWDPARLEAFKKQDLIIVTGRDDPHCGENEAFSGILWAKGIGNALRIWDGWGHDWPYWEQMLLKYVSGHD